MLDGAGNPVTDGNGDPVTTTTDTAGNYQFTNLTPGDYTVVETQPAGLFNVSEDEGGIDDDQPDNNTINSIAATVNPGENDANNDFVEVELRFTSGNVSQDTKAMAMVILPFLKSHSLYSMERVILSLMAMATLLPLLLILLVTTNSPT